MDRMRELVDRLNALAREYYVLDSPSVSDREYDALYDELLALERDTGRVEPDSPTRRVGGEPLKGFERHRHIARLYSLDKGVTEDELDAFFARVSKVVSDPVYTVEYKFDGLTMCLTYENGVFSRATTRGNGVEGEDVTAQCLKIRTFPLKVSFSGVMEVQGEAVIPLSALSRYNETAKEPLKNARNAAAGAVRNLDPSVTAERGVEIYFYNVNWRSDDLRMSQIEQMEYLKSEGFKVYPYLRVCRDEDAVKAAVDEIEVERKNIDVLTDGAVIKLDDAEGRARMGYTDKFPRWAIAYKYEAEEATTVVREVRWQVGRTGKLTPLAVVDPVELAGATVRRATLNNFNDLQKKDVKVGSEVLIRRSNEVIPEILRATKHVEGSLDIEKPSRCPYCGSILFETGANIFCPNVYCKPRVVGKVANFASKGAMDIDGVSEMTASLMYDALGLRECSDLYSYKKEDLERLDGFKDKRCDNFLFAIEKSKDVAWDRFIFALGIDGVGKVASKDLAREFSDLDDLFSADEKRLRKIDDIGAVSARQIRDWLSDERNEAEARRLLELGVTPRRAEKASGVFDGQFVVLTGSLSSYSRGDAQREIEARGGECQSSVTKKTTLVVAGESAGSKLSKAQKTGVRIIDEAEFLKMLKS